MKGAAQLILRRHRLGHDDLADRCEALCRQVTPVAQGSIEQEVVGGDRGDELGFPRPDHLRHLLLALCEHRADGDGARAQANVLQDDLQRATDLVRRMITELGMSTALGLSSFDSGRGMFLDVGMGPRSHDYSEETARQVDAEVRRVLDEHYKKARALIREHREAILRAVDELLTTEVMDGARFRDIIAPSQPAAATGAAVRDSE